jgi:hypothetical protein
LLLRRDFRPWLLLAALQLADIVTTAIALTARHAREANRFGAAIIAGYGQPTAYLVKALGVGLVMWALWHYRSRRWARVVLWTAVTVTAYTVASNTGYLFLP